MLTKHSSLIGIGLLALASCSFVIRSLTDPKAPVQRGLVETTAIGRPIRPFSEAGLQRKRRGWRWAPPVVAIDNSFSPHVIHLGSFHPGGGHRHLSALSSGGSGNASRVLFRFALITDSHLWPATASRRVFSDRSDAASIRDGLLISRSPEVYASLLRELSTFAAAGGSFAVHAGDSVCGGATFGAPTEEYEAQLRALSAAERSALGTWPIHHVAGNHDLHPSDGGLDLWQRVLGNRSGAPRRDVAYRALALAGWRLLLLDSSSDVEFDTDGHGRIGEEQLTWLEGQLELSARLKEQVVLVTHQLLVKPIDRTGHVASWLMLPDDMIENAEDVLTLLRRYSHVKLALHGHVHANSLTVRNGIAFVSTASATEYPMQWREVIVRPCDIELHTRSLHLPELLNRSARREAGRGEGRNMAKRGDAIDNHVILQTC